MIRKSIALFSFFGAVLFFPLVASACTCVSSVGAPACEQDLMQQVVFVGKVIRMGGLLSQTVERARGEELGTTSVDLELEEVLYGKVSGPRVRVYTTPHEAACGYSFKRGETYVVYAHPSKNRLYVSLCSRTGPRKYREEDIAYFHGLPTATPTSRIYGTFKRYTHDPNFKPTFQPSIMDHYRPPEETYRALAPMAGAILTLRNNGLKNQVTIDQDGRWSVDNLPPGEYELEARLQPNLVPVRRRIAVGARKCAELNLRTQSNGRIKGTVVKPWPADRYQWFTVEVFREDGKKFDIDASLAERSYNDEAATTFEIGPLPPGKYRILLTLVAKPSGNYITFYPEALRPEDAAVIELGDGQVIEGIVLRGILP